MFIYASLLSIMIASTGCTTNQTAYQTPQSTNEAPTTTTSIPIAATLSPLITSKQPTIPIKNVPIQNECIPPRLKSGFKEFDTQFPKQDSSTCTGIGAPVFNVPDYPAGPIVNDSVVGKFGWWSNLGYCEFRNDSIWILYARDNQPHYYHGSWIKLGNSSYTTGKKYTYQIKIFRPNAMNTTYYNETLIFLYDPEEDRFYLAYYDGTQYWGDISAWIGRLN